MFFQNVCHFCVRHLHQLYLVQRDAINWNTHGLEIFVGQFSGIGRMHTSQLLVRNKASHELHAHEEQSPKERQKMSYAHTYLHISCLDLSHQTFKILVLSLGPLGLKGFQQFPWCFGPTCSMTCWHLRCCTSTLRLERQQDEKTYGPIEPHWYKLREQKWQWRLATWIKLENISQQIGANGIVEHQAMVLGKQCQAWKLNSLRMVSRWKVCWCWDLLVVTWNHSAFLSFLFYKW